MQNLIISGPDAITESETVDFVAVPSDDSLGIEICDPTQFALNFDNHYEQSK